MTKLKNETKNQIKKRRLSNGKNEFKNSQELAKCDVLDRAQEIYDYLYENQDELEIKCTHGPHTYKIKGILRYCTFIDEYNYDNWIGYNQGIYEGMDSIILDNILHLLEVSDEGSDLVVEQWWKDKEDNAYIYGIYIDNELAYLGKTIANISEVFTEHIMTSLEDYDEQDLWKDMRDANGYKFVILYEWHNDITNEELSEKYSLLKRDLKPKYASEYMLDADIY